MQTTLTSTIIKTQSNYAEISRELDEVTVLHNLVERTLYAEIQNYFKLNNVNKLPTTKVNELKSKYTDRYNINARQYNSIKFVLDGKVSSILALNKDSIIDLKDKIKDLEKSIKSKNKTLFDLLKKKQLNHLDKINLTNIKTKLFYLNQKLIRNINRLAELELVEKTGNVQLCFGSKKLFRQQFLINSSNNLTEFKSHEDWLVEFRQSRNKTFFLVGSSDETLGNQNCQIKHIENNIYELKVNVNPKEPKLVNRYINILIELHNDKNNLILNAIKNGNQAISYRFYKDYKNDKYKVFISLDKSKQSISKVSHKELGTIGVDINADHLAVTEVDRFGNLKKCWNIELNLKDKSSNQSLDKIACAVKKITDYAVKVNKPIVIEKLDFSSKKKELKSSYNKKYNVMLSSFAYSKIIQLVKSRSFDKGIDVIEVNPAYTSKIGKFKYQNQYKLTTHQAAAFVIARRGLLSFTKYVNKFFEKKDKTGKVVESCYKRDEKLVINKEKTISIRRIKHYFFELPDRNIQRENNVYWREVEQNYLKVKKYRLSLKKKKKNLVLDKDSSKSLSCELTQVADSSGVYRDSNPDLLFQPF